MKRIEIEWDDFTKDEDGEWSQVCDEHFERLKDDTESELSDASQCSICGVKGCEQEANYYIDFKYEDET